jgi:hypothetical protein
MGTKASQQRRQRLSYIVDILNALSSMTTRDGSALLRYFIRLAAAQARDEHAALNKGIIRDDASTTQVVLN